MTAAATPTSDFRDALDELYPGRLALLLIRCRDKKAFEKGWNLDAVQRYENGADRAAHFAAIARHLEGGGSIGWTVPPGALVIDCDSPESVRAVAKLMPRGVPLQKTPRGTHFVVAAPPGVAVKSSVKVELSPGVHIDVRSAGHSQILVEPSPDGRRWLNPLPPDLAALPPCPPAILERIVSPKTSEAAKTNGSGRILEGARNDTLASFAGKMRHNGMEEPEIAVELLSVNRERCDPPLDEDEVRRIAKSVSRYAPEPAEKRRGPTIADRLVRLAQDRGVELTHNAAGVAYATVPVGEHVETHAIKGAGVRRWLARRYWEVERSAPPGESVRQALAVLEAQALFDGGEQEVYLRVAPGPDGAVWLDLGDAAWRAVRIDATGWRVVGTVGTVGTVRFTRARGMLALPAPDAGGGLAELVELLPGAADEETRALLLGWLVAALRPSGPYPVLLLHGEQGAGKTTAARMLRRLVDPAQAELRAPPRDERDLAIATNNGWVVGYDNLSGIPDWFSDALCRVATGGGFATRELYSDTDECIIDATRPVLVNGIDNAATRGDLLDRALLATLPPIAEYRPESELWARFDAAQPRLLGALLDAVSLAIRREAEVEVPRQLRLADAARWVAAAEPALPVEAGAFVTAYSRVRAEGRAQVLESSRVGTSVVLLLRENPEGWEGTAGELLGALELLNPDANRRKDWPWSPRGLVAALHRLAPALRAEGIEIEHHRAGGGSRRRLLRIAAQGAATDRPDRPDRPASGRAARDGRDGRDGRKHPLAARSGRPGPRPVKPRRKVTRGSRRARRGARP